MISFFSQIWIPHLSGFTYITASDDSLMDLSMIDMSIPKEISLFRWSAAQRLQFRKISDSSAFISFPQVSQKAPQKNTAEINAHIWKLRSSPGAEHLNTFINGRRQKTWRRCCPKHLPVMLHQSSEAWIKHQPQHCILKNMRCFPDNMIQQPCRHRTAYLSQPRLYQRHKEKAGPFRMNLILHGIMPDQKYSARHKKNPKKSFHKNSLSPAVTK